jgi:protein TonB
VLALAVVLVLRGETERGDVLKVSLVTVGPAPSPALADRAPSSPPRAIPGAAGREGAGRLGGDGLPAGAPPQRRRIVAGGPAAGATPGSPAPSAGPPPAGPPVAAYAPPDPMPPQPPAPAEAAARASDAMPGRPAAPHGGGTTDGKAAPGPDAGSAPADASAAGVGGAGLGRGAGRGLGPTDGPGGGIAGTGAGAAGTGTGPGGGGQPRPLDLGDLLARIRHRIEAVKRYPEEARRDSIQGTVSVRFRVHADGRLERVELVRSSGSRVLDEASLETIRRAAPFPPVRGWVQVPLAYTLGEAER